jgi:hypothetical protein
MTYRDHYHPKERADMGTHDEWKTNDRRDEEPCRCCGGERVVTDIVPRGGSWEEVTHDCSVCSTGDDRDDEDPEDRPLPTEDCTGVREPD